MQAEIDHINSGNVRAQDSARIGQQLATDLLLIPTIERFEYPKSVRKLRMSDRELVSYSGGARITLRLLNAATGQVVMSQSFDHKLADADPSTMPRVIDGKSMAAGMMDSLASRIGGAIVTEIFPVSVVSLSGDQVVLSQGGDSLQVGQRWKAVYLGEELKDPQTGNSLGRNRSPRRDNSDRSCIVANFLRNIGGRRCSAWRKTFCAWNHRVTRTIGKVKCLQRMSLLQLRGQSRKPAVSTKIKYRSLRQLMHRKRQLKPRTTSGRPFIPRLYK